MSVREGGREGGRTSLKDFADKWEESHVGAGEVERKDQEELLLPGE